MGRRLSYPTMTGNLTFAPARISGGMTLSGPKACLGSTKEVKILAAFLHSPAHAEMDG